MQNNKPRITGAIFENTSGRGPRFTGVIEIDGRKEQIAFWDKTSERTGKSYLQISEDRKKPVSQGNPAPQRSPSASQTPRTGQPRPMMPGRGTGDMDDDIPF